MWRPRDWAACWEVARSHYHLPRGELLRDYTRHAGREAAGAGLGPGPAKPSPGVKGAKEAVLPPKKKSVWDFKKEVAQMKRKERKM